MFKRIVTVYNLATYDLSTSDFKLVKSAFLLMLMY